ncbi:MAG: glycosyltransferase family 39 protein [Anaerolineae bacterium]|nr:glycosyltransferase family 39 protein [Anaerolineae bacterium]
MRTRRLSLPARLWLMTALFLIGAAVRIAPLTDNRFHPDEALFATLARLVVSGRDPLLSTTPLLVDKPPLFYYTLAGGIALVGGSELAARLPGLFAGLISLALTARLAWQLWRSESTVWWAMALMALSPFTILFAPTVFADPQFVMWLLATLVVVGAGRWGWGGVLFGLAMATKQNALFFAPLVLGVGLVQTIDANICWRRVWGWIWRFALAFGLVLASMLIWDVARQGASSFWSAGVQVNDPGRLARSREVWPRAVEWLGWLHYLTALSWLNAILAILLMVLAPLEVALYPRRRGAAISLVLLAFAIGYLGLQWLVAFPVLDRYLLPLVPLIALLSGRAATLLRHSLLKLTIARRSARWALPLLLAAMLAWPAWRASNSTYPIGGDHGVYDGIDQAGSYLRRQPEGSVVYYHALGWMMDYYLFDGYLYLTWFASPAWLSEDLSVFGHTDVSRYLVLSKIESPVEIQNAIRDAGCKATPVIEPSDRFGAPSIVVYRLSCELP